MLSKISNENIAGRADIPPHSEAPVLIKPVKQRRKWPKVAAAVVLLAAMIIVAGFGFVHVINGSSLPVPHVVLKGYFGYKETFVNIDKITGMPWVFAKLKYPIGCKVLQDSGHIESNEAFELRVIGNYKSNTLAKSFDER